ncbi:hypothetical protein [Zymobacter palmae]|uniref:DNA mismatch repair protein MutS n=1 Tax=Zymobacter palmae TaxID=33074 RepID=A0A348HEE4_9GAMM|nr:hypothetical protein [Zymobacter palmae]BBG29996.1 DNA mismatch repair protein MutS [Zymobacter palmae]
MSEARFTTGVWSYCAVMGEVTDSENEVIATLHDSFLPNVPEEQRANGYLIAVAPAMYVMLETIACVMTQLGHSVEAIDELLTMARSEDV